MNTRILAAAILALAGTSAFAGGEFDPLTGFNLTPATPVVTKAAAKPAAAKTSAPAATVAAAPGLTREEVKAEFLRSRANNEIVSFDTGVEYAKAPSTGVGRDRDDVRAEARASVRGGKSGS